MFYYSDHKQNKMPSGPAELDDDEMVHHLLGTTFRCIVLSGSILGQLYSCSWLHTVLWKDRACAIGTCVWGTCMSGSHNIQMSIYGLTWHGHTHSLLHGITHELTRADSPGELSELGLVSGDLYMRFHR